MIYLIVRCDDRQESLRFSEIILRPDDKIISSFKISFYETA